MVFRVLVGHGGQSARARAEAATAALKEVLATQKPDDVRVEERADSAVVYAGRIPICEVWVEDARAAGDASVRDHAARIAAQVREAVRREQKRSAIATTVFSLSLVVLTALFALYLLRKLSEFAARARDFVLANPGRIPALRVYSLEVIPPAALRSALVVGLGVARLVAQVTVVYLWLLGSLSLFEATRPYTERLTALVVSPILGLLGRIVATVPMLVVTGLAVVVVLVVLRFVGLFFGSVARGETRVAWLPAELAGPTSVLLRLGIVGMALVFGAPVVTGDSQGALARAGTVIVAVVGLAATPLLATALTGAALLFSKKLASGDRVRVGTRMGQVRRVGLLDVELESDGGALVRVPHLALLLHPWELAEPRGRVVVELAVASDSRLSDVEETLTRAAGDGATIELVSADADALRFRVSLASEDQGARITLLRALLVALGERGVRLGRSRTP